MKTIKMVRVVEYSQFFQGEDRIEVSSVLKTFNREKLIRMASLLSVHYGNFYSPSEHEYLFSKESHKNKEAIDKRFKAYFKRIALKSGEKVVLFTYRTSLELFRDIFSIRKEDYLSTIADEDQEIMLFKIVLTLNEKIMRFDAEDNYPQEKILFASYFLKNDCNDFEFGSVLATQIHYFKTLVDFIPNIPALKEATNKLLTQYGISSWQQYYRTILTMVSLMKTYLEDKKIGLPIINEETILRSDTTGRFSTKLVDHLSVGVDDYIPYDEGNEHSRGNNTDYRCFRAKPLIRLEDGKRFLFSNTQLVCERLYNGLTFDLIELLTGSYFNFNKDFVEKELFRKTMFNCIDKDTYTFPPSHDVREKEENGEPDFYVRQGKNLLLMECKTIKVNGSIKDKTDIEKLFEDLKQKLAYKTHEIESNKKIQKPKLKGLGQLAKHIDLINKKEFKWDRAIPDDAVCFPILVLEDPRLLQPGLLKILNNWYDEIIKNQGFAFNKVVGTPVMAISIRTLFLYDDLIKSKGLPFLIDEFLQEEATKEKDGRYTLSVQADFEAYLRSKPFDKRTFIKCEMSKWLREI